VEWEVKLVILVLVVCIFGTTEFLYLLENLGKSWIFCKITRTLKGLENEFPVSVEAKLSFVEPSRRWAHSSSPSKAPGISYQGTMKTSIRMLKTS